MAAQNARTAGWFARFERATPGVVLGVLLGALVTFFGWVAVSLVDLRSDVESLDARVTALEARVDAGFEQTNERLTRLEERVDDIYERLGDLHVLLAERLPPPPGENRPQR